MSAPEFGAAPITGPEPEPEWQRPHPLTLVGEIATAIPTFIGLVFFIRIGADDASDPANVFELLFLLGPVITGAARYFTTRFAVGPRTVHLQRGLIVRRKQAMPRANIQNVSSSAGVVGRALGLSEVKVSDASAGAEITIRYLDTAGAEALVHALRPTAPAPAPTEWGDVGQVPPTVAPQPEGRVLKVADNVDLIRAEAARVVPGVVGLLPVVAVGMTLWSSRGGVSAGWGLGTAGSIVALALLMTLWQGTTAFFSLSGFTLSPDADGFRTRQGAFTEVRNNARRDRIQMVRVHEDLMLRAQNLERVSYDTADVGASAGATSYLSPAGPRGEWRRLVADVLDPSAAVEPELASVNRLTIRRTWVRWAAASVFLLPLALVHPLVVVLAVVLWGAAGYVYGPARWRMLGYDLGPTYLVARTGVVGHRLWIIRADKIQAVTLDSTFFQRRLGLASVRVGCAGRLGALTIPDLSADDARDLFGRLSIRSASTPLGSTI